MKANTPKSFAHEVCRVNSLLRHYQASTGNDQEMRSLETWKGIKVAGKGNIWIFLGFSDKKLCATINYKSSLCSELKTREILSLNSRELPKSSNKDYHMISPNGFTSVNIIHKNSTYERAGNEWSKQAKKESETFSCTNNWKTRAFQVCVN